RLCAQGGNYGAGIGAGSNWKPGSITIAGGTVEARSGASGQGNGAGIGGGNGGTFGLILLTGGKVFAYGGAESSDRAAAGIGGGVGGWYYGVVGRIEISGGTVYASGGRISDALFAADIGEGLFWSANADINAAVVITGGSVVPAHFDSEKERFTQGLCTVTNMAHDATGRVVHAVTVALGTPGVPVAVDGLPDGYGTNDIYSDDSGTICLWLPDGTYAFTAGGSAWTATIDGADSIAQPVSTDTGVLVDGTDAGDGSGNGWTYDPATSTLAFNASGTYNVSGTGPVRLSAADGVAVTLAPVTNLTLSGASPILTGPGTFAIAGGTFALDGDTAAPLAVTGGSLHLGGTATPPVSNATEAVYCVAITNLAPDAPVAFSGLPAWYGTDSIVADAHGNVFLWLPAGDWSGIVPSTSSRRGDDPSTHVFSANGYEYTVAFEDDAATVASVRELPLENLEILDATLSPDGTSLVLTVVAAPATWTHGFADTLSVLQITDLSSTNSTSFSDSTLI
ncbi:MAG: hypothetical protein J6Y19_09100, partial [Kiritimatiellae bacterium]|nr:hypothetical protein [Kiritimatiellia bacterium]